MRSFNFFLLSLIFLGCGDISNNSICPECNMPIPKSNKVNTAYINKTYFDDIGCMILWIKKENMSLDEVMVFTKDTKQYIKAIEAYYSINEKTPMGYGFTPYQNNQKERVNFKEMRLRMLRGETIKNPKIRKQILGY